jgi:hypothetical protein
MGVIVPLAAEYLSCFRIFKPDQVLDLKRRSPHPTAVCYPAGLKGKLADPLPFNFSLCNVEVCKLSQGDLPQVCMT